MNNAPHIIASAVDGETYDLMTNRIRWDLLPADVQQAFRAWPHGLSVWTDGLWFNVETMRSIHDNTYRARPAPKATEHVLWWRLGYEGTYPRKRHKDTHKIIIRRTGDTLPFGTYKLEGSDATFTVEKAQ